MKKFRVTYVDSVLREAVIEARTANEAEEITRQQLDGAEHHHAIDAWNGDWQAEPYHRRSFVNSRCFECGERRE